MENVFALGYRNQNRAVFERFIQGLSGCGYWFNHRGPSLRRTMAFRRIVQDSSALGYGTILRCASGAVALPVAVNDSLGTARDEKWLGRVPAAPSVGRRSLRRT